MKKILGIYSGTRQHRIGDDLLARTLFSQRTLGRHVSPFLALDHVAPTPVVATADACKPHLHGNCKMLTMVRQGQLEYVDAAGKKSTMGAGDVQWLTLSGAAVPGTFRPVGARRNEAVEMLQLWIDLPQSAVVCLQPASPEKIVTAAAIPVIELPGQGGRIRVIAGQCESRRGAMPTTSSFDVWELQLKSRCMTELNTVAGRTLLLAVLSGALMINGDQAARDGEVVMLDRPGTGLFLETYANTTALLLSGEAINAAALSPQQLAGTGQA